MSQILEQSWDSLTSTKSQASEAGKIREDCTSMMSYNHIYAEMTARN